MGGVAAVVRGRRRVAAAGSAPYEKDKLPYDPLPGIDVRVHVGHSQVIEAGASIYRHSGLDQGRPKCGPPHVGLCLSSDRNPNLVAMVANLGTSMSSRVTRVAT